MKSMKLNYPDSMGGDASSQDKNEYINYLEGLLADQEPKADRLEYAILNGNESIFEDYREAQG